MGSDVKLYVYRINDHEYGAGIGKAKCEQLGTIVEEWPLNSRVEASFLASHGTSYHGASEKVSRIADAVHDLMVIDPTFSIEPEIKAPSPYPIPVIETKPNLLQRIYQWFFAR
jgi:hypothetical protein